MSQSQHIIIVDDEAPAREMVGEYLKMHGFTVTLCDGGKSLRGAMETSVPDLVVLDLNMAEEDGLSIIRDLKRRTNFPVIMLTATASPIDRVVGLELGADDYVGKPFSPREVVARVKSVLRRLERAQQPAASANERRVGAIVVDPVAYEVRVNGKPVTLTPMQFKLLDVLSAHVGQTLTREQLLERVSGEGDVYDRTLDRHIANLRARVEPDPANPRHIITVFGVGYKMVDPS
jgi:DNA-binding response OmpR family regulator